MFKATNLVCVCMQHCVYGLNWLEIMEFSFSIGGVQLENSCRLQDQLKLC